MANNEIVFRIKVNGKGEVSEAVADTKKLRQEVDKTGSAYTQSARGAEKYAKSSGAVNHAKNSRDVSRLREEIGGDNGLVSAYATLAVNTFAVVAAFTALKEAMNSLKIISGLEAQSARLGSTLSLTARNIREITDDSLSMVDAMKATAQLTAGGFNSDQISELAKVAKDASGALGRDLNDSMDRLTRGVTKLEPELLDEIGLMTKLDEASSEYATTMNKSAASLTAAEKRQAFMNSVLEEGQRKFGGIGDSVDEFNSYTRLAATGVDLFNDVIGTLAKVLSPIVEIFADNKFLMASAIVLYASSIKDDLLPALSNAAEKQALIAKQAKEMTIAKAQGFAGDIAGLNESVRGADGRFKKNRSSSIIQTLVDDLSEGGDVSANRFTSVLEVIQEEYDETTESLKRAKNQTDSYYEALSHQDIYREAASEVRNLASAYHQQEAASHSLSAVQRAQNITFSNFGETMKGVVGDLKNQFSELQRSSQYQIDNLDGFERRYTQATAGIANGFRTAVTGIKALGAAFLNFLPVIGQVMFAFGLLKTAVDWVKDFFTTAAQKEYNKVQEEFNTIIEASADKTKQYAKMTDLARTSSSAQIDVLKLTGNAISEVTDKFIQLQGARKNALDSSIWKEIGVVEGASSGNEAIDDMITKTRIGFTFEAKAANDAYIESLKAVDTVMGVVTKSEQAYISGKLKEIDAIGDSRKQLTATSELITELNERYSNLTITTENLAEAYKNLEKSTTQFIQSAKQSTPVDDLREKLSSTVTAIKSMNIEMDRGALSSEQFGNALSSIGSQSRNLLGASLPRLLELEELNIEIKRLDEIGEKRTSKETATYNIIRRQAEEMRRQIGPAMQEQLSAREHEVRLLQRSYRLLKDQLALEDARFKKVSDMFDVGAAGFLAREEHAEKMRSAQVAELEMQQGILKSMQLQSQITLDSLERARDQLALDIERLETQREISEEMRNQSLFEKGFDFLESIGKTSVFSEYDDDAAKKELTRLEKMNLRLRTLDVNIDSARDNMEDLNDSIASLEIQKAAILAQNLTAAEKAALAMGEEFKVSLKFIEQINRYAEEYSKTSTLIVDYNKLISLSTNDIEESVRNIKNTYDSVYSSLVAELAEKRAQLKVDTETLEIRRKANALTGAQGEAAKKTYDTAVSTYLNEEKITKEKLRQAEVQMNLDLLTLAVYDTVEDGVKWQKEGLDLYEKQANILESNRKILFDIEESFRKVARLKLGIPETNESAADDAIRAAAFELKTAKASYAIRSSQIDAEYALMDAQRRSLEIELRSRMAILAAQENINPEYLRSLEQAITNIGSIDIETLRNQAQRGLNLEISLATQNLEEAVATAMFRTNEAFEGAYGSMVSSIIDSNGRREALEEARLAKEDKLSELPAKFGLEITRVTETGLQKLENSTKEVFNPILEVNTRMADDVSAIRESVTSTNNGAHANFSSAGMKRYLEITAYAESRNRDYNSSGGILRSPVGAMGRMQVMPATARDPGYGIRPWNNTSMDDLARVGEQLFEKLFAKYGGDLAKAWAAYNWGAGNVDKKVRSHGSNWLSQAPAETRKYVEQNMRMAGTEIAETAVEVINRELPKAPAFTTEQLGAANTQVQAENPRASENLIPIIATLENIPSLVDKTELVVFANKLPVIQTSLMNFSQDVLNLKNNFQIAFGPLAALAEKMGPDGEIISAMSGGISNLMSNVSAIPAIFEQINSTITASSTEAERFEAKVGKMAAVGASVSSVISTIGAITAAASAQRVRGIEAEIAAEQQRDGKSAESLKKIEALEKKKDQTKRKQFNTNKKLMMAEAVIATATGIAKALTLGPIVGPIMAAVIGAMGAAQLAIISGTTYQGGSASSVKQAATPPKLTIGKVGSSVNLDRKNANAGGEIGYLRGTVGYGNTAGNYNTISSAYGGSTNRGYGHRSFLVGDKGPETIETSEPMVIKPKTENVEKQGDIYQINATDAESFANLLRKHPGDMAEALRKLANSSGERFMEGVDTKSFKASKR